MTTLFVRSFCLIVPVDSKLTLFVSILTVQAASVRQHIRWTLPLIAVGARISMEL